MQTINKADDPALAPFLTLRNMKDGTIVVDGPTAVRKLLSSGLAIIRLVATKSFIDNLTHNPAQETFTIESSTAKNLVGISHHSGVMAWAQSPHYLTQPDTSRPLLILNGLTKAENVGAIIRNAAGLGIDQILYGPKCCPPFLRRSIRTSMGNVFVISHIKSQNLSVTFDQLKEAGFTLFAASAEGKNQYLHQTRFPKKSAIVIGSEGHGIESNLVSQCHHRLAIPITPAVAHYNASCAAAMILYELQRQRAFINPLNN
jgi:tRNA G18 (ribose-2'-O)-methylase SpoU